MSYDPTLNLLNINGKTIQELFHESAKPVKLAVCGEQSGKTIAVMTEAVLKGFYQANYEEKDLNGGYTYNVLICEPRNSQIMDIAWPLVMHIIKSLPFKAFVNANKSEKCIYIVGRKTKFNGSEQIGLTKFKFNSYEQREEAIEGNKYHLAVLDECFQATETYYDQVRSRVSTTNGQVILSGSVKPNSWIQKRIINLSKFTGPYDIVTEKNEFDTFSWYSTHNPVQNHDLLEKLKEQLPEQVYKRRYEAALDAFEGQVFSNLDKDIHFQEFQINCEKYETIVAGVDWGYTHLGTILLIGITKDENIEVFFEYAEEGVNVVSPDPDQETWLQRASKLQNNLVDHLKSLTVDIEGDETHTVDAFYCDPAEPEHIEIFESNGIRAHSGNNERQPSIDVLMTLFNVDKNKKSKIKVHKKNCPILCDEIVKLRWNEKKKDTEDWVKEDDHVFDALRYAVYSSYKQGWLRQTERIVE